MGVPGAPGRLARHGEVPHHLHAGGASTLSAPRTVTVHAFGFAGTLRPRELVGVLGEAERSRVTHSLAVLHLEGGRVAVLHDFGALVLFGFERAEREAALAAVLAVCPEEPHPPIAEDFTVRVAPGAAPAVTFDEVVVPALDDDVVEVVALVLAQSVAMDYYEADVAAMLAATEKVVAGLASGGRPLRARALRRMMGETLLTRSRIATTLSLLDAPAVTWEREPSDRLHRALRATFETEDRYRTLQHKLQLVQEQLTLVAELSHARRAEGLEIAVVLLILLELLAGVLEAVR